jgi:hypothetical protein
MYETYFYSLYNPDIISFALHFIFETLVIYIYIHIYISQVTKINELRRFLNIRTLQSFRKYVSTIAGNHDVRELQKTAILGTEYVFRTVLM